MIELQVTGRDLRFGDDGLVPAIIQDARSRKVLMLGYMNEKALRMTRESGKVTFYSRSRSCIWQKGETSGNTLLAREILSDCDGDALLVLAEPLGPTCHTGSDTCWKEENTEGALFLERLEDIIESRIEEGDSSSYTVQLIKAGAKKIAQKVGEEGVETALEGAIGDQVKLAEESADLLYHLLVLLRARSVSLSDVVAVLRSRHK